MLIIFALAAEICHRYQCTKHLPDNQCIQYANNTISISPCDNSDQYCPTSRDPTDSFCTKSSKDLAYPGEPCIDNSTCAYGFCQEPPMEDMMQVCKGQEEDDKCEKTDECDPGLWCYKSKCKELRGRGDSCGTDYECMNNMLCDGGRCAYYFNEPEEERIYGCHNNRSEACESGMCFKGYCLAKIESDGNLPVLCDSYQNCTSSHYYSDIYPVQFYTDCECGLNQEGTKYCGLFPGDSLYNKYLKLLKDWHSSAYVHNCNTLRRRHKGCLSAYNPDWEEYQVTEKLALNYSLIQDAEDCTKEVYFDIPKDDNDYGALLSATLGIFILLQVVII